MDYRHELKRFPKCTFPPEYTSTQLADGSSYVALPVGRRMFAWFTYTRNKNVCFLVDGKSIMPTHAAFSNRLALGTVLVGTLATVDGARTFVADGCLYEAGAPCTDGLVRVLRETDSRLHLTTQLAFMEAVSSSFSWFEAPYKIRCVKDLRSNQIRLETYAVMKVAPCEQIDTYTVTSTKEEGVACIDTIARSIMMNDLFRYMPENHDLDCAEEEVPEVSLGPPMMMECRYHVKRKEWVPIGLKL